MASEVERLRALFYKRQIDKPFKPRDKYNTWALILIAKNLEEINHSLKLISHNNVKV